MKFKELSKNDKIFRVINLIFMTENLPAEEIKQEGKE